jgi:hypothetical protein
MWGRVLSGMPCLLIALTDSHGSCTHAFVRVEVRTEMQGCLAPAIALAHRAYGCHDFAHYIGTYKLPSACMAYSYV